MNRMSAPGPPGDKRSDPHAGQPVRTAGPAPEQADAALALLHGRGAPAEDMLERVAKAVSITGGPRASVNRDSGEHGGGRRREKARQPAPPLPPREPRGLPAELLRAGRAVVVGRSG